MAGPRVALPFADWPAVDRAAWEALFREGDLLDGRGEAVHWASATRETNLNHYARWLGWLAANDLLAPETDPADRATPALVTDYARSLVDRVAPWTAASALIGLKCVLQRMRPDAEWRWLKDRDCQEFRVRAGIVGKKETPHAPTQTACDRRLAA